MFYERFEALCKEKKVTPSRAVQDMGFSRSLAAKWKHTGDTPKAESLPVIAKYFGISVAELLDPNEKTASPATDGFTEKEQRFLYLLRQMDSLDQEWLEKRMMAMLESK